MGDPHLKESIANVNQFTFAQGGDCYAFTAGDFRGLATGAAGTRYFEPDGVAFSGLPVCGLSSAAGYASSPKSS
jgi:hypothetical protein